MKFETIDENQINDIMEGKPVREPDGWDDQTPTGGSGSSSDSEKVEKDDKGEGKIGGPAGEH